MRLGLIAGETVVRLGATGKTWSTRDTVFTQIHFRYGKVSVANHYPDSSMISCDLKSQLERNFIEIL